MTVLQTLDLSTAHITNNDMELFGYFDDPRIEHNFPLRVSSHTYGWMVFLPDAGNRPSSDALQNAGLSTVFCAVIDRAYTLGCQFVNFDRDAEIDPGLAVAS